MKDFLGKTIKLGDTLAYVKHLGSGSFLTRRYVIQTFPKYIIVQSEPGPPLEDKRFYGRLTTTQHNCIILD